MIDQILWWVGAITAAAGTTGLLAFIIAVSVDHVLRLTGFSKSLLEAYARLQTEKMHERQRKEGRIPG